MKEISMIFCLLLCTNLCVLASMKFPEDSGIIDVTKPPYNARGDGKTDDTASIQKALAQYPSGNRIIYLPEGIYLVSDTLKWPKGEHGGADHKRTILEGDSQGKSIIKLKDNCPGYKDIQNPKSVIWTGKKPAQRFRNAIRDLTVNTGVGNVGAIGIQFIANNQGCMRNVTIRSGDSKGVIGLDMSYTDEEGPCLIKNIYVKGYDFGIKSTHVVDSITFEHINLENQNQYGFYNRGQCVSIRKLSSKNSVPAVCNAGKSGVMTLIDIKLEGLAGASENPAIINEAAIFARNLMTSGYEKSIRNDGGHGQNTDSNYIEEFVSHPVLSLFPSPQRFLKLPVVETPEIPWGDLSQWTKPEDSEDDTQAIQNAIDSGKTTVYLPNGKYKINGNIYLRGKTRRIIGCEAWIEGKGKFVLVDGEAPLVIFERIQFGYGADIVIEHASSRTLIISSCTIKRYENTGNGDLFIEDVVGGHWIFNGQKVWARQLNAEQRVTKITNDGGNLWILGLKTERGGTLIETRNGGKTELVGGFCYATSGPKETPMFINDNSSVSITIGESCFNGNTFIELVRETRAKATKVLKRGEAPGRTGGSMLPLYVGYIKPIDAKE